MVDTPSPNATEGRAVQPSFARGPVVAVAALLVLVLLLAAGGYGYHRDELYFLAAGRHLAWGYVDQGPLTPLFARIATAVAGDSLVGLRVLPALFTGMLVIVTALLTREFGGRRGAQTLAAACAAVSAIVLQTGHLLSTTTFDLLVWAVVAWLTARALRRGGPRWLLVGLAAGIGLQNKMLVAFLLLGLLVGLVVVGPRRPLRDPWMWGAGLLAAALWAPYLAWQAAHGWPQVELSGSIATGGSTSSEPWWLVVPFQLVLVSPLLVPVWVAGLVTLWRSRTYRLFPVAYALLAVLFTATGGKPYYLGGLYPVLLAAGAEPVLRWVRAGRGQAALLGGALVLTAAINATLMLPVVPVAQLKDTPVTSVVPDVGETVGWPEFAATVAGVVAAQPPGTVVLTANYGEAGAVQRSAPGIPVVSGHNSYADWGTPPDTATAVVVGYPRALLRQWCGSLEQAAVIDDGVGLDNQEQGRPVWVCRNPVASWTALWPRIRHIG
ncbi:glycosyltransferase family 39 protein [Pseudonocardia sp. RS11V-5]|uniref:glycosyltransferase family 39 protein n=1 Tax=Pseudonocardia terrae TaxID=2905831 RepID=UPI001E2DE1B8|nr:glycosyltransferase family 39 protein [Pseudonocardia terrae]MCE3554025.1 glycosyltransferase family 39 protein [Pseudonocardia terrae]